MKNRVFTPELHNLDAVEIKDVENCSLYTGDANLISIVECSIKWHPSVVYSKIGFKEVKPVIDSVNIVIEREEVTRLEQEMIDFEPTPVVILESESITLNSKEYNVVSDCIDNGTFVLTGVSVEFASDGVAEIHVW